MHFDEEDDEDADMMDDVALIIDPAADMVDPVLWLESMLLDVIWETFVKNERLKWKTP